MRSTTLLFAAVVGLLSQAHAANPIITNAFTADPAAMVHNDRVYLYTGHDEAAAGQNAYVMRDWLCYSTGDMVNWKSEGSPMALTAFPWALQDAWAGHVVERGGKFYWYVPMSHKTITGFSIGVAVSDSPTGPFVDARDSALITNNMTPDNAGSTTAFSWDDIDPAVFIDDDGQAWLFWGNTICHYVKLKANMIETDGAIQTITLPSFTEAPWVHKRNGIYYLSYAYGWEERIAYATATSINGPWTFRSVINNNVTNCNTNHQAIIDFKGKSYFIYHNGAATGGSSWRRSVCVDLLNYNSDGTIQPIVQTTTGITPDSTIDPPTPTFAEVSVHDPAVIKAGARWYVYGSHGASAWTEDMMRWTQVATTVTAGTPAHFNTFQSELSELIAWTTATSLWAADVIQLADGKFHYYYNVWTDFQGYRSYMGQAVADGIEGPYVDVAEVMKGGTGVAGFNPAIHPNTIDPDVFYDKDGLLWMVYGSYSGGIFILRLDQTAGSPTLGQPLPGQGWGTKLIGGNHAVIEGSYVIYSPESQYYYLFTSFAGLAANGAYNMRVFRSVNPNGPYFDAAGNDMSTITIANNTWAAIAPYGVKVMGNCQFQTVSGETGTARPGYVSPGHNSVYYDPTTDKYFLIFHTRFVGLGEQHQVRVHQMFVNADGWLVVAPHRYAGETIAPTDLGRIVGNYKLINHGKDITTTVKNSTTITLAVDGTVSGSATGTWQLTGDYDATLVLGGVTYHGVFVRQWDESRLRWLLAFSAIDPATGTEIWGSKVAINTLPAIVAQPANATVTAGVTATFSALASGDPAPTYQWRKNGANIAGATESTLIFTKAAATDAASYTVVATNSVGSATSSAAALTVNVPPTITSHPASVTQLAATSIDLSVVATGTGALSYQWFKDGASISSANSATLSFASIQAADAGDYTVAVTDSVATTTSRLARIVVAAPATGRISNLSVRSTAGFGGSPLIVGFVVDGGAKDILVRAVGPTLASYGVSGTMPDPRLDVIARVGGVDTVMAANDNWGDNGQAATLSAMFSLLGAFPLASETSKDASVITSVSASRTVHVNSMPPVQSGVVLVECYDTATTSSPRLVNVSARNFAGIDSQTLIAGFVIDGNQPKRLLIRGIGPTLADFGVPATISDPRLAIYTRISGQDRVIATNDDWATEPGVAAASSTSGAFALRDGSYDAAIVLTLPAGVYTAHVSGFGGATGEALVEVYELP